MEYLKWVCSGPVWTSLYVLCFRGLVGEGHLVFRKEGVAVGSGDFFVVAFRFLFSYECLGVASLLFRL